MVDLQSLSAKICYTASGTLIYQGKILLIKHKKLGIWLTPGGHIEADELPHQAAEREFWEETSIKVRAVKRGFFPHLKEEQSEFLPVPLSCNLHWVSKANYEQRHHGTETSAENQKNWGGKGCEQHFDSRYLMEPVDGVEFKENVEETLGIAWFGEDEIADLETPESVRQEILQAFEILRTERKK